MENQNNDGFAFMINDLGNAAFDDENKIAEIARLLRLAADQIESGREYFHLFDINGNRCGKVYFFDSEM